MTEKPKSKYTVEKIDNKSFTVKNGVDNILKEMI